MLTPDPAVPPSRARWALALTSAAFFMVSLDALVVILALPSIHLEFGAGPSTLQWTVNAYTLACAAAIIPAAALADRFGRRRVFSIGLALFTAASAACAVASSAELLVAARAVQGIAAGVIMPLSLTILTSAFPVERRGAMIGIWGALAGLAVAIGPLVDLGKASGVQNIMQRFGSAFTVAIAAAVFANNGSFGAPASFIDGFRPALVVVAGVSIVGALTALLVGLVPSVVSQSPLSELSTVTLTVEP